MGFRFRTTIKIMPGVRLNLSKSGVSTSVGVPGATLNVGGRRGPRVTVGAPGTGLSYSQQVTSSSAGQRDEADGQPQDVGRAGRGVLALLVLAALVFLLVMAAG